MEEGRAGAFLLAGSGAPFFLAGGIKIAHGLRLYRAFRRTPALSDPTAP